MYQSISTENSLRCIKRPLSVYQSQSTFRDLQCTYPYIQIIFQCCGFFSFLSNKYRIHICLLRCVFCSTSSSFVSLFLSLWPAHFCKKHFYSTVKHGGLNFFREAKTKIGSSQPDFWDLESFATTFARSRGDYSQYSAIS